MALILFPRTNGCDIELWSTARSHPSLMEVGR
jgi:hypothetical protein